MEPEGSSPLIQKLRQWILSYIVSHLHSIFLKDPFEYYAQKRIPLLGGKLSCFRI